MRNRFLAGVYTSADAGYDQTVYASSDLETWEKIYTNRHSSRDNSDNWFLSDENGAIIIHLSALGCIITTDALRLPVIENAYIKALE